MLNEKKTEAILQWYNSLTTKGVECLVQFADGSHFYDIITSINSFSKKESKVEAIDDSLDIVNLPIGGVEEVTTSREESDAKEKIEVKVTETSATENSTSDPFVSRDNGGTDSQKKYEAIKKFLTEFYELESNSSLINYNDCLNGKELELAKVVILLLFALVQNLLAQEDNHVYNATLLEEEIQEEIKECLSYVLEAKPPTKAEFHKILSKQAVYHKGTPRRRHPSRGSQDKISESVRNVPKKRRDRTSFIEEDFNSSLKSLLESPKIQFKTALIKKDSEFQALRRAYAAQEDKMVDMNLERKALKDDLEKKKRELEFVKEEHRKLRESVEEFQRDEMKEEVVKNEERERFKLQIENQEEEIRLLNQENKNLSDRINELVEKKPEPMDCSRCDRTKSALEELLCNNESLKIENSELKDRIQLLQIDVQSYKQMFANTSVAVNSPNISAKNSPKVEILRDILEDDKQSTQLKLNKAEELLAEKEEECIRLKKELILATERAVKFELLNSKEELAKEVVKYKKEASDNNAKYKCAKQYIEKQNLELKNLMKMFRLLKTEHDAAKSAPCKECIKAHDQVKELTSECKDYKQKIEDLKALARNLQGKMQNLVREVKDLTKEKKRLEFQVKRESAFLAGTTSSRESIILQYFKAGEAELDKRKAEELARNKEQPVVNVNTYIVNGEKMNSFAETSTSNTFSNRSIRNDFCQVADEEDFLNQSSLAEIHNGDIANNQDRMGEIRRRNTLCPRHLQSSYPLEIQNMTPSEKKYYENLSDPWQERRKTIVKMENSRGSDTYSVNKRKFSDMNASSASTSRKFFRPSSGKPVTPRHQKASMLKRQSFRTPSSIRRLMNMPRKNKDQ